MKIKFLRAVLFLLFVPAILRGAEELPSAVFDGERYVLKEIANSPGVIENIYLPEESAAGGPERSVVCGMLVGASDCLAFAKSRQAAVMKGQPGSKFEIVADSTPAKTVYMALGAGGEAGSHAAEVWSLQQPNANIAVVYFTRFRFLEKGGDAREKLNAAAGKKMGDWIRSTIAGGFPPVRLPVAEETVGNRKVAGGAVEAKGVTFGVPYRVDDKFAAHLKIKPGAKLPSAPPAPFQVVVPKRFKDQVLVNGNPNLPETALFALGGPGGELIESVQFSPLTHGKVEDTTGLLAFLGAFMELQFVRPQVIKPGGKLLGRYSTLINGLPAAVILAQSEPEGGTPLIYKYVALPQPSSTDGLVVVLRVNPATSADVKEPGDLAKKGFAAEILHSVRFLK